MRRPRGTVQDSRRLEKLCPFSATFCRPSVVIVGSRKRIDGKVTIGAQPAALGMNVPLTLGQRLEVLGSSPVGHAFSAGQSGGINDKPVRAAQYVRCLLYTSDAADDLLC